MRDAMSLLDSPSRYQVCDLKLGRGEGVPTARRTFAFTAA